MEALASRSSVHIVKDIMSVLFVAITGAPDSRSRASVTEGEITISKESIYEKGSTRIACSGKFIGIGS